MVQIFSPRRFAGDWGAAIGQGFSQATDPLVQRGLDARERSRIEELLQSQEDPAKQYLKLSIDEGISDRKRSSVMDAILQSQQMQQQQQQQKAFKESLPLLAEDLLGAKAPSPDSGPEEKQRYQQSLNAIEAFGPQAAAKMFEKRALSEDRQKIAEQTRVGKMFEEDLAKRPVFQEMQSNIAKMRELNTVNPFNRREMTSRAVLSIKPFVEAITGGRGVLSNPKFKLLQENSMPSFLELPQTTDAKLNVLEDLANQLMQLSDLQMAAYEASGGRPTGADLVKINKQLDEILSSANKKLIKIEADEKKNNTRVSDLRSTLGLTKDRKED